MSSKFNLLLFCTSIWVYSRFFVRVWGVCVDNRFSFLCCVVFCLFYLSLSCVLYVLRYQYLWIVRCFICLCHVSCMSYVTSISGLSVVLFVCVMCLVCPTLPVSLDCLFLIAPSVFSNVYCFDKASNQCSVNHSFY